MLMLRAANVTRDAEWSAGKEFSLSFRGNELAGEVGEACNVLKKLDRERMGLVGSRATVADAAEELADVVICADLAAMDLGIDLNAAVVAKFNATSEKRGLATRMSPSSSDCIVTAAAKDVLAERQRQVEGEGWTPEHDDAHRSGELASAAAAYATQGRYHNPEPGRPGPLWPWAASWWKPSSYRRNLVKAGALILAEIERLDRASA